jgi:hypothetical protein
MPKWRHQTHKLKCFLVSGCYYPQLTVEKTIVFQRGSPSCNYLRMMLNQQSTVRKRLWILFNSILNIYLRCINSKTL